MNASKKTRKRAVRLTDEGLATLRASLVERWRQDQRAGKLTRETQAALLGVSGATVGRILAGEGVDRSTLALAFRNLGLAWNDDFCESPPFATTAPDRKLGQSRRGLKIGAPLLGLAALCLGWKEIAPRVATVKPLPAVAVEDDFDARYEDGITKFHRGDYIGARVSLEEAISLARQHDAAGQLSSALRLAGDLAEAQGRLEEARDRYREAVHIRRLFAQEVTVPPIDEALGEVETRLRAYGDARNSLARSLVGYRKFNDPVGVAMASRDLGSLEYFAGNLDSADRWFKASADALKGILKPDLAADLRERQALVLLKRGRKAAARDALRDCLNYWTAKAHPRWIAECEMRLGMAEAELGHFATATVLVSRSKEGFERTGDEAGSREAADGLRRLSTKTP